MSENYSVIGNKYAAVSEIIEEYARATSMYGKFSSSHEGYAIIKEELDELWAEIKKKKRKQSLLRKEACQIAAMALRFMVDLT